MRRAGILVFALIGAALACGPPLPAASPAPLLGSPTDPPVGVTPLATLDPYRRGVGLPPERSERVVALVEGVSADYLMSHVEALAAVPSRHVNSRTIRDAAVLIHDHFEDAGGRLVVGYEQFPLTYDEVETMQINVIATLPGSDPSAGVVLVGAHYDSRAADIHDAESPAPGADDNATGVAALLEMARLLSHWTPRATIVFAAFSAEEIGAWGSKHTVQAMSQRGDQIRAVIVLDIVGNAAGPEGEGAIRAFSAPPEGSPSRQLSRFVALQGQTYVEGFDVQVQPTVDREGRYSDHISFSDAGVPAIRLIEAVEDTARQHSVLDRPELVSPDYLRQATQLALASAMSLADGPPAPLVPYPLPGEAGTLAWYPVEGAAGYGLAFRRAGGLEIDTLIRVGAVTSLTWDGLSGGEYAWVSVAAFNVEGLMSALSPELSLTP